MSVFGRRIFPDLCLINGWQVTILWVNCMQPTRLTQGWWIQKFWKGGGGGQCISPVVIHRKCTQQTICLLYEKGIFQKKIWANGEAAPSAPLNPPLNSAFHPSRTGKLVAIHVFTWITGVETIKMAYKGYVWLNGCKPKSMCAGLG